MNKAYKCINCKGSDFSKDDEEDTLCCVICGTQSQDYIAESFDIEGDFVGGLRAVKKASAKRFDLKQPPPNSKLEFRDYILRYQYLLSHTT